MTFNPQIVHAPSLLSLWGSRGGLHSPHQFRVPMYHTMHETAGSSFGYEALENMDYLPKPEDLLGSWSGEAEHISCCFVDFRDLQDGFPG